MLLAVRAAWGLAVRGASSGWVCLGQRLKEDWGSHEFRLRALMESNNTAGISRPGQSHLMAPSLAAHP